jgi:hypothetical protein
MQAQHHEVDLVQDLPLGLGSLRRAGSMLRIAMPGMPFRRSRMPRPVVPASPSMKTVLVRWLRPVDLSRVEVMIDPICRRV